MEGIQINRIISSDFADPRGPTYEWCKGLLGQQVTIFYRNAGIIAGNHYHKGNDPSKNPEFFFLLYIKYLTLSDGALGTS